MIRRALAGIFKTAAAEPPIELFIIGAEIVGKR
jgi:hypothetical protein